MFTSVLPDSVTGGFVSRTPSCGASCGDDRELAQALSCFPECGADASVDSAPFQLCAAPSPRNPRVIIKGVVLVPPLARGLEAGDS